MKKIGFILFLFLFSFKEYIFSQNCHSIGYAHLDPSWRWSINEGINKMKNTCIRQLENLQRYPHYKFSLDNICEYEWMEKYYPEIFSRIKEKVKEGRWEPFGGMWADPLMDTVEGESIVRQYLVGKRYVKEKFDFEIKVGANLDNYSSWPDGNIPQIAKKCGIDYYVFCRGLKETNGKFFWWVGNDGTKIFAHDTENWYNCDGGCNCSKTEPSLKYYGKGDGGGGPSLEEAETCSETGNCSRLIDFFEEAVKKKIPEKTFLTARGYCLSTDGDRATGVLTHRPFLKWFNRKCLVKLIEAEKFSLFASSLRFNYPEEIKEKYIGGCLSGESENFNYPQQEINYALKKYLFWQHHDNLPGNFTWDGVKIAWNDLENVYRSFENIIEGAILTISSKINTEGEGIPVLVFNSLSWERTGVVEIDLEKIENFEKIEVRDYTGKIIPYQIVCDRDRSKKLVFLAENVPATGYKLYRIVPAAGENVFKTGIFVDEKNLVFENEYFILQIDKNTGFWKRVYDKKNKREVLKGPGNVLGYSNSDKWPYGNNFDEWGTDYEKTEKIEIVEKGPVRVKIRSKYGPVYQDTILYFRLPRIDCFVHSENYKKENGPAYLRVVFPLNIPSGTYTTEAPYGVSVSPDRETTLEKPALSWQDLSDREYGVSLINDSKYGGDRDGEKIKLSLISHPEFEKQNMLYSLYPHKGGWKEGNTPRVSYEVNYPLIGKIVENHSGVLPPSYSFLKAEPENIIVSVVKKHEDTKDAILRIYETTGKNTDAKIIFGEEVLEAFETDMIEWEKVSENLSISQGKILNLKFSPYEIKTLRIKLPEYFENKLFIEHPSSLLFVKDAITEFSITLNNSTSEEKTGKIELSFPGKYYFKNFEIKKGEIKSLSFKIEEPPLQKGILNLKITCQNFKEEKKIPYEVISLGTDFKNQELLLYKIYEGEELLHKTGRKVQDVDALNKICWCAQENLDKKNEHIIFGPYTLLPEGRYLVSFRIKNLKRTKEEIATIDVFATSTLIEGISETKTSLTIKGEDFPAENIYKEFVLFFKQKKLFGRGEFKNEFRVFWRGNSSICVDRISLFKILQKR